MNRILKDKIKSIVKGTIFSMLFFCLLLTEKETVYATDVGDLYAEAAVLMDGETGRVLYGKNEEMVLPMASTTKIMTCIIALEHGALEDEVTVSSYAAGMPDVQLNIREGETYLLKDLLYSLMLESHNDSAVAIAEHIGGSVEGFAILMNQKAKEIGAMQTSFLTPNGLDATGKKIDDFGHESEIFHSTTAKDLALIMKYCISESPRKETFLEITQTNTYEFSDCDATRKFICHNHNSLLWKRKDAISGKTGFTNQAGYCYVGAIENEGRPYIVALLACGWPYNKNYKWKDCETLFSYGIKEYSFVEADVEEVVKQMPSKILVKDGCFPIRAKEEEMCIDVEIAAGDSDIPKALLKDTEDWEIDYVILDELVAPIQKGKKVGEVHYKIDGVIYNRSDIVTGQFINRISLKWYINQIFRNAFLLLYAQL